jgi:hypothetical protein
MGSICVTGPISLQMPVVERACEVTRGTDRAEMLRFACQFTELGGWVFQDAADLVCAMHWTDRALDYALELGDQRVIAYTLMRKAVIATESRPCLRLRSRARTVTHGGLQPRAPGKATVRPSPGSPTCGCRRRASGGLA